MVFGLLNRGKNFEELGRGLRRGAGIVMLLLAMVCAPIAAMAAPETSEADEWEFIVTPYVWVVGLQGDLTVKGRTADVDASFLDIIRNSDSIFGFLGNVEVRKGKWGAFVDGTYFSGTSETAKIGPLSIDADVEMAIVSFGAFYRIAEWSLADAPGGGPSYSGQKMAVDFYAGGRYTSLDTKIDANVNLTPGPLNLSAGRKFKKSPDWVDPIFGLRTITNVFPKVKLLLAGDIGGFGAGSDFTWHADGLLGYDFTLFSKKSTVWAGYRALYQDYKNGSGNNRFEWKMTMHGPVTGLSIHF